MKSLSFLFFALMACLSCSLDKSTEADNQETIEYSIQLSELQVTKLKGEVVLNEETQNSYPYSVGNFLFMAQEGGEWAYRVYKGSDLSFVGFFGRFGQGPTDVVAPKLVNQFSGTSDSTIVYLFDSRRMELFGFQLQSSLNNLSPTLVSSISFPLESHLDQYVVFFEDPLFYGNHGYLTPTDEKVRLSAWDIKDSVKVKQSKLIPEMDSLELIPGPQLFFEYMDYPVRSPQSNFIFSPMLRFNRIDIFYVENLEVAKTIIIEEGDSETSEDKSFYFLGAKATNEAYYALYAGQSDEDYFQKSKGTYLIKFNLEGNFERLYQFDQYIVGFTILEENDVAIGVDLMNEKIFKFNFE